MKKTQLLVVTLMALLMLSFLYIQPALAITRDPNVNVVPDTTWTFYGKVWDVWTCGSDSMAILLFGGYANNYPGTNEVRTYPLSSQVEYDFVNSLHAKGIDVMTLNVSNYGLYDITTPSGTTWLTYIAAIFRYYDVYDNIYLFGHSAGGVVVGYEIQKTGADDLYDAAVMAMCPVDWDGYPSLYHTADTAQNAKVPTSFIACQQDGFYSQMWTYYSNMVIDKEWHEWEAGDDPHNPFPDECTTHPGETLTDAVYNWFVDPDIPLTIHAYNQMGQPLSKAVYIDDEYVGTTFNTFQVKHGFHKIEVPSTQFGCYQYDGSYDYSNPTNISITSAKGVIAWYM